MLGPLGPSPSPVEVNSVIFGLRCPLVLQYSLVKILGGASSDIKFWRISSPGSRFELKRRKVNVDELMSTMPLRSVLLDFDVLEDENSRTASRDVHGPA